MRPEPNAFFVRARAAIEPLLSEHDFALYEDRHHPAFGSALSHYVRGASDDEFRLVWDGKEQRLHAQACSRACTWFSIEFDANGRPAVERAQNDERIERLKRAVRNYIGV